MIKVDQLFRSANGTQEDFEIELPAADFDRELTKPVQVHGVLIRVEEGIAMGINELTTEEKGMCSRCQKELKLPIETKDSEWIFYTKTPKEETDLDAIMLIDIKHFTIDLHPALHQEIELHRQISPRCEPICREFDEPQKGVKALAGLRDLTQK